MEQLWLLANLDKRLVTGRLGRLGAFFTDWVPSRLIVENIIHPLEWTDKEIGNFSKQLVARSAGVRQITPLLRMPADVTQIIFDCLDEPNDAVCLCLVDRALFYCGFRRVMQLQRQQLSQWAGNRLVLAANTCLNSRLPEPIMSKIENDLPKVKKMAASDCGLYHVISRYRKLDHPAPWTQEDWTHNRGDHHANFVNILRKSNEYEKYVTLRQPKYLSDPAAPWVLCNITKGVYVRADAIAEITHDDARTPLFSSPINLGHVVMSYICCTSAMDTSLRVRDVYDGQWAGDAFEITTLDRLDVAKLKKGLSAWIDVSQQAKKRVEMVFDASKVSGWTKRYVEANSYKKERLREELTNPKVTEPKHKPKPSMFELDLD